MPPHVFAYLDLASGSMIIQAAIAGIVVVPVLMRNKIRALLGRGKPAEDLDPMTPLDATDPERAPVSERAPGATLNDATGSDRS